MRFRDFKVNLVEASTKDFTHQKAIHALDTLDTIINNIPDTEDPVKAKIANNLNGVLNIVNNFIQRNNLTTQIEESNLTEDTPGAAAEVNASSALEAKLNEIANYNIPQEQKDQLTNLIYDVLLKNIDLAKEVDTLKDTVTGYKQRENEANEFLGRIGSLLITLGNKVQNFEEASAADLKAMSSEERNKEKKKIITAKAFTTTLRQAIFGLIIDIKTEQKLSNEEIEDFLASSVQGKVLNMLKLVKALDGNVRDFVATKYQKAFDVFVSKDIFSYSPGKTSGAIGPGEMALSMFGNPAEKANVGDIKVGEEMYEVKASKQSGGRLNSKQISKATNAWSAWRTGIQKITKNVADDELLTISKKNQKDEVYKVKGWDGTLKAKKKASRYNWNPSGFKALNNEILIHSNRNLSFQLFWNTIKALVLNIKEIPDAESLVKNAIEQDGQVDYDKMTQAYTKIAYESYHLADGVTNILLLNTKNLHFHIIASGDNLVQSIQNGNIKYGGGFNWNDDQQTPTPGYMAVKK